MFAGRKPSIVDKSQEKNSGIKSKERQNVDQAPANCNTFNAFRRLFV
jgi:hypothetical protein